MHAPYDATPKSIAESFPDAWPKLLGFPARRVEVIDADVSTVSGAADKVFRIDDSEEPWLLLLEFLTGYKKFVPERLHWHSTLVSHRHEMRVRSVLVLLRPEADGRAMTGMYEEGFPEDDWYLKFRYRVIRLWEIPAATLIESGAGLAALAPLGKMKPDTLVETVRAARKRIEADARPQDKQELLASMYILMGMRYDEGVITMIEKEVSMMEESVSYQMILRKGELNEAHKFLLLIGSEQLGRPDAQSKRKLREISDVKQLHRLGKRIGKVQSWKELLGNT